MQHLLTCPTCGQCTAVVEAIIKQVYTGSSKTTKGVIGLKIPHYKKQKQVTWTCINEDCESND